MVVGRPDEVHQRRWGRFHDPTMPGSEERDDEDGCSSSAGFPRLLGRQMRIQYGQKPDISGRVWPFWPWVIADDKPGEP